tara:strand:+ start:382 stop:1584 length:1203 start_codon:yes stop_codon:yes gene_type:complete
MFRGGGKVSSYGNGIASGMGYAGGGRVNLRVGGNPAALVNLGGGGGAPTQSTIGGNILNKNVGRMSGIAQKGANLLKNPALSEAGIMNAIKNYGPKAINAVRGLGGAAISRFPALSFGLAGEYLTRPQDVDQAIYQQEGYGPIEGRIRQVLDPTYMSKMKKVYEQGYNEDGQLNALINQQIEDNKDKDPALDAAEENPNKEITVDTKTGDPVLTKKERLDKAAKEYEEILGAGIKKDSIFDAMIEGGTRLYEGEGAGSAIRAANKALDPIQNIKTASRKLALEEDIAIRKAIATGAAKDTDMSRKIAALRAGGYTPEQIADAIAGIKPETLGEKVSKLGKVDGYAEYIKENRNDVSAVVTSKSDTSQLPDGKYYIADKFTIVEVKNGQVVKGSAEIIKSS